jgi:NADH dehydrogenase/NADH:ubiquinone oxidoreductase subunit G
MDVETLNIIKAFFEEEAKGNSGTVIAAALTVSGMFGVALLGAISQWRITKRIVDAEHKKLEVQLKSEFQAKRHEKWESDVLEAITELLTATDPEINEVFKPAVVTKHVNRVQLLLNRENALQAEVNNLVNYLALTVNGWKGNPDELPIFEIHGQLLDASKKIIYQPK